MDCIINTTTQIEKRKNDHLAAGGTSPERNRLFTGFQPCAILYALPVILMFLLALTPGISFIEDLGRHILLGRISVETGQVPTTNLLTYTYPDFPFINHHWLSQVVFYFAHGTIGLNGLILLKVLLMCASLALAMHAGMPRRCAPVFVFAAMLTAIILGWRAHIRPELFTYLGVALYGWIIARTDRTPAQKITPAGWLLMICYGWFWANAHIYFIFGIGMIGVFWLTRCWCNLRYGTPPLRAWPRGETIGLLALISISLINPNGWRGLLYPLNIFTNYGMAITENASPFQYWETVINPMLLALPILAILSGWVFCRAWHDRRELTAGQIASALILAVALIATAYMARSAPLPALTLLPVLGFTLRKTEMIKNWNFKENIFGRLTIGSPSIIRSSTQLEGEPVVSRLSTVFRVLRRTFGIVAVLAIFVWLAYSVVDGAYSRIFPSPIAPTPFGFDDENRYLALRRLYQDGLPQPVFSDYNIGSLVEYNIYPAPGYVDNRPEAFPAEFWRHEYQPALALGAEWEEMIERRGIQTVAVSITGVKEGFIRALYNDPRWQLVHIDFFCAVFVRNTLENRPFLLRHAWGLATIAQFANRAMQNIGELPATDIWHRQILAEQIVYEAYALICLAEYMAAWQLIWQMHQRHPDYQIVHELMRVSAPPYAAEAVMDVMARRAHWPLAVKQVLDWGAVLEAQGKGEEARQVYSRAIWFFPLSHILRQKAFSSGV